MYRLLYISTARQPFTPDQIEQVLATSRRNNTRVGVTGLLIVGGGKRFLQALEGPRAAVEATYDRIKRDPRHFAVVELARGEIESRSFTGWAMGHQNGGLGRALAPNAAVSELIAPIGDPTVRGYFEGFAQVQAAA